MNTTINAMSAANAANSAVRKIKPLPAPSGYPSSVPVPSPVPVQRKAPKAVKPKSVTFVDNPTYNTPTPTYNTPTYNKPSTVMNPVNYGELVVLHSDKMTGNVIVSKEDKIAKSIKASHTSSINFIDQVVQKVNGTSKHTEKIKLLALYRQLYQIDDIDYEFIQKQTNIITDYDPEELQSFRKQIETHPKFIEFMKFDPKQRSKDAWVNTKWAIMTEYTNIELQKHFKGTILKDNDVLKKYIAWNESDYREILLSKPIADMENNNDGTSGIEVADGGEHIMTFDHKDIKRGNLEEAIEYNRSSSVNIDKTTPFFSNKMIATSAALIFIGGVLVSLYYNNWPFLASIPLSQAAEVAKTTAASVGETIASKASAAASTISTAASGWSWSDLIDLKLAARVGINDEIDGEDKKTKILMGYVKDDKKTKIRTFYGEYYNLWAYVDYHLNAMLKAFIERNEDKFPTEKDFWMPSELKQINLYDEVERLKNSVASLTTGISEDDKNTLKNWVALEATKEARKIAPEVDKVLKRNYSLDGWDKRIRRSLRQKVKDGEMSKKEYKIEKKRRSKKNSVKKPE